MARGRGPKGEKDFFVVAIGVAEGNRAALEQFFSKQPEDSGMAFVVLHQENQPPSFLKTMTTLPVSSVTRSVKVKPNHVYNVPFAKQVTVEDGKLRPTESKRGSLDSFFRSLAEGFESRLIAVLLSSAGSDGTLGLRYVKEHWGVTLVQNADESAVAANVIDIVLPAAEMPQKLLAIGQTSGKLGLLRERITALESPPSSEVTQQTELPPAEVASDALNNILALIKEKTGHDFHNYKQPTLLRRIARRLQVHELSDMAGYLGFLNKKPEEIQGLLNDLLISVTNFFRDEEAFEALRQDIIPKLFANKTSSDTVRVWSCGCATGEEAYSLAMLFSEYTSTLIDAPKFQIFASDISEEAIRTAREGHYDEKSIQDVSPERLQRFFIKDGDGYRVKKELRDTVLFALHNVLRDPPFSRLELISCRNLLIYLNRETQEKVLKLFQFAMRPGGYLFLGSSESTESASGLFTTLDKQYRLYQSRATETSYGALSVMPSAGRWEVKIPDLPLRPREQRASYGELHYKLLEGFAPPSILVNEDDNIVHVSEHAGAFLRVGGGEPTRHLFQAVKPALKLEAQRALFEAKKGAGVGISRGVPFKQEGKDTTVTITVRLVKLLETGNSFYLVTFASSELDAGQAAPPAVETTRDTLVEWLEEELQTSRVHLRMTVEQYETSAEELRASNEELQAVNEELRAASEELETSKEELQSLNEELMTMVDDQKRTEGALRESETKYRNLFESIDEGFCLIEMILDKDGEWADYLFLETNQAFEDQTGLKNANGKTALQLVPGLETWWIETYGKVAQTGEAVRFENHSAPMGRWFEVYASRIGGATSRRVAIVFNDISERKRFEEKILQDKERFQMAEGAAQGFLYDFLPRTGKVTRSENFKNVTGYGENELEETGTAWESLFHPDDVAGLEAALAYNLEHKLDESATEYRVRHKNGHYIWVLDQAKIFRDEKGDILRLVGMTRDITKRKLAEDSLRRSEERLRLGVEVANFALAEVDYHTNRIHLTKEAAQLYGLGNEEMTVSRERVHATFHPDEQSELEAVIREVLNPEGEGWFAREHRVVWPNGEVRWLTVHKQVFFERTATPAQPSYAMLAAQDITERKQAEETLRQNNAQLQLSLDASAAGTWSWDVENNVSSWDDRYHALYGFSPDAPRTFEVWLGGIHPEDRLRVQEHIGKLLEPGGGEIWNEEFRAVHPAKGERWMLGLGRIERTEAGKAVRFAGINLDISERKLVEEQLKISDERMKVAQEAAKAALYEYLPQTDEVIRNASLTSILGYAPDEIPKTGAMWQNLIHPEDMPTAWATIGEGIASGAGFSLEYRVRHKDGHYVWLYDRARAMRNKQGEAVRVVGLIFDISERKLSEQALRKSHELFARAEEAASGFVFEWTVASGKVERSSGVTQLLGYTPEDLATRFEAWEDLVHPDDKLRLTQEREAQLGQGQSYTAEYRVRHKDGHYLYVWDRGQIELDANGDILRVVGTTVDVTERKNAEQQLQRANERFRIAEDAANGFIYDYNPITFAETRSEGFSKVLGYTQEEVPAGGPNWEALIHPDDVKSVHDATVRAVDSGEMSVQYEYRIRHKDGHYLWVLDKNIIVRDGNGEAQHIIGSVVDITERKKAEEKLQRSEAELRLVTDAIPALVSYVDTQYHYRLANKTYAEWFGLEPSHMLGKTMAEILGETAFEILRPHIDKVLTGQTEIFESEMPYKYGGTRFVHAIYTPDLQGEKVDGFFVHTLDITERKRREANLAFLDNLGEEFSRTSEQGIMQGVGAKIGAYLGVSRCTFVEINEVKGEAREVSGWHSSGVPVVNGVYQLSELVSAEPLRAARAGETIIISDTQTDPRTNAAVHIALHIHAFVSVPFHQGNDWKYLLTIFDSKAREWRDDEIELFEEVTNRVFLRLERVRAAAALRESEQRFQAIFAQAAVGIAQVSPDGRFMQVNHCFCEITGYSEAELLGNTFQNITHPEDVAADLDLVRRVLAGERDSYALEKRYLHKDGSLVWANLHVSLVRGDSGAPRYFISVIEDISKRKRAELEAQLLAALGEAIRRADNADDLLNAVCELTAKHFGVSHCGFAEIDLERGLCTIAHEYRTQDVRSIMGSYQMSDFASAQDEVLRTGQTLVIEDTQSHPLTAAIYETRQRPLGLRAYLSQPVLRNDVWVGTLFVNSTTPRRWTEANIALLPTIAERTWLALEKLRSERALIESEKSLRETDKRKDEFLATLAHELRNPLAPIRTGVEIMKRTNNEATQQEARDIIERQSQQMVRLIDDLLDISRISRGTIKLKKERLELSEIVQMAVESAHALIEDRDHQLTVSLPDKTVWLGGDKTRLCQIVLNLLTNAAKYTESGGKITLTANLDNAHVIISVKDNGIGIPEAMLTKVFEMFTRVERETSYQQEGLGIGLNLVKQLVELHGGSVEAFSGGENQGSTFTVHLPILNDEPVRDEPLQEVSEPVPSQGVITPRRVLVVDDYEPNRKTLSRMLRLMGHEVLAAGDGKEALAIIKTFAPEIILLDINMPGMNGYEVAKQIRSDATYTGIKLVALTGYGQESDVETALSAGFDAHLVKPVDLERLEGIFRT